MKTTFTVGDEEKHQVEVEISYWSGRERIYVDGKQVVKKFNLGVGCDYKFIVGENEKHNVEVKGTGFFTPKIEVFVDGKLQSKG